MVERKRAFCPVGNQIRTEFPQHRSSAKRTKANGVSHNWKNYTRRAAKPGTPVNAGSSVQRCPTVAWMLLSYSSPGILKKRNET